MIFDNEEILQGRIKCPKMVRVFEITCGREFRYAVWFNEFGNMCRRVQSNGIFDEFCLSYDSENRLVSSVMREYSSAAQHGRNTWYIDYKYDNIDNAYRKTISRGHVITYQTFNSDGHIISEVSINDANGLILGRKYMYYIDAFSRISGVIEDIFQGDRHHTKDTIFDNGECVDNFKHAYYYSGMSDEYSYVVITSDYRHHKPQKTPYPVCIKAYNDRNQPLYERKYVVDDPTLMKDVIGKHNFVERVIKYDNFGNPKYFKDGEKEYECISNYVD